MLRISAHDHIDRIEQSLQITLLGERCSEIRHDDVPHEHYFFIGKINQHGIVRFTALSWDQLELRSADVQVRSIVDRNVRFVAHNIVGAESLSKKLLREDLRRVEFLLELFLIVAASIKFGTRVQATEVRMTADMVPVCVSNEHCCQWRQSRCIRLQRFVCTFCEIRARARVNADEFVPVLGNHKIIFRKFEAGQRVDATGNDLGNAPRRKRMTGGSVFGKRRCQCDRTIEIGIAAAMEIIPCFGLVAVAEREFAEMIIDFAQPSRMRRFVCVLNTPGEFFLRRLTLVKISWKLRVHDTSNPVHNENLTARKLLRLIEIPQLCPSHTRSA